MLVLTAALVYYAYRTIDEGKKDRTKDSIEKQLENLYNPLFEIMSEGEPYGTFSSRHQKKLRYRRLLKTDRTTLRSALVSYGHYLDLETHEAIKSLLYIEEKSGKSHVIFPDDETTAELYALIDTYGDCLRRVREKRKQLIADYRKLTRYHPVSVFDDVGSISVKPVDE